MTKKDENMESKHKNTLTNDGVAQLPLLTKLKDKKMPKMLQLILQSQRLMFKHKLKLCFFLIEKCQQMKMPKNFPNYSCQLQNVML